MKSLKFWIWTGVAVVMLFCSLAFAPRVLATDKPKIIPKPAPPIVITEHDTDYRGAIVTALGMYFYMRHRAKKREFEFKRPEPVVPTEPPTCEVVTERVFETCVGK